MLQEGELRRVYFHNSISRSSLCVYLYTREVCTGLNSTFDPQKLKDQGRVCLYSSALTNNIFFIETDED
jgi:hypothetical protein